MSAYKLCLSDKAAEQAVDECSEMNAEALEMKEHRNCLVGIGHFVEAGVLLQRNPRLSTLGLCLKGEELQDVLDFLDDDSPGATVVADLRPYLVGVAGRCGQKALPVFCFGATTDAAGLALGSILEQQKPVLVYSSSAIVQNLQSADGMTEEEAEEYYQFNIVGAWVGQGTPLFL